MRSAGRFFYFDEDRLRPHLGSGLCLADTAHLTTMCDRPLYGDTHCAEISVALRRHHRPSIVGSQPLRDVPRPGLTRQLGVALGAAVAVAQQVGHDGRGHLGDKVA